MKPRTYRFLQALLLIGLGNYLLFTVLSGRILWYINSRFVWLTVLGVVVLALSGLVILLKVLQTPETGNGGEDPAHIHTSAHDHEHEHGQFSVGPILLLLFPILLGVIIPVRPLSAASVQNRGVSMNATIANRETSAGYALIVEPENRTVLDWIRIFNYEPDLTPFFGQTANVVGFVYRDARFPQNHFMVSRFAVTCCVADAFALGMVVEWAGTDNLPTDSWVRVKGPVNLLDLDGQRLPLIRAESIQIVDAPDEPYLFP